MTMKSVKFSDMLSCESGIIVHGCNSHGVMGSGIAWQIRQKYPQAYEVYRAHCMNFRNNLSIRSILGDVVPCEINENLVIMNAITQEDFGREKKLYVDYSAIYTCFKKILSLTREKYPHLTINYPLIGAGLGGGDWAIISDIIDTSFSEYPDISRTLWIYR